MFQTRPQWHNQEEIFQNNNSMQSHDSLFVVDQHKLAQCQGKANCKKFIVYEHVCDSLCYSEKILSIYIWSLDSAQGS